MYGNAKENKVAILQMHQMEIVVHEKNQILCFSVLITLIITYFAGKAEHEEFQMQEMQSLN